MYTVVAIECVKGFALAKHVGRAIARGHKDTSILQTLNDVFQEFRVQGVVTYVSCHEFHQPDTEQEGTRASLLKLVQIHELLHWFWVDRRPSGSTRS